MIHSGKLRHLIQIKRDAAASLNDYGEPAPATAELVAEVMASVQPQRAKEQLEAGRLEGSAGFLLRLRFRSDVDSRCYVILKDGRRLDIKSLINVEERGRELELVCVEHQGGGA
jgi:SPP1 family predicted phage head-tail adaptor